MAESPTQTRHVDFLDGIRALAALYVLLFHVLASGQSGGVPGRPHTKLLMFGHEAVVVFIVVSGYCLMLSPARSAEKRMRGGWARFLKRRAWRILPPYYAALFMYPLYVLVLRVLASLAQRKPDFGILNDMLGDGKLLSHLLLVHNFRADWAAAINSALWSIATEFQIYLVFVFLLLPLWRRFGSAVATAAGFSLGLGLLFLLPGLQAAAPVFIGIFALGMSAAVIGLRDDGGSRAWRERLPWGAITGLFLVAFIATVILAPDLRLGRSAWATDTIVGFGTASCIVFCAKPPATLRGRLARAGHRLVVGILESRPMRAVGRFSYSLYLAQLPLLAITGMTFQRIGVSTAAAETLPFRALVVIPLLIGGAYLFYLLVEQHFLPERLDRIEAARQARGRTRSARDGAGLQR